jgi:hypothetical protein
MESLNASTAKRNINHTLPRPTAFNRTKNNHAMYTFHDFVPLKDQPEVYCGCHYQLKRYVSKDKKVLLTFNNKGLSPDYWRRVLQSPVP